MLFFVLSGFLMGHLYLAEQFSRRTVSQFVRRRVARVFPLYLFVVFVSFVAPHGFHLHPVTLDNVVEHLLFWRGSGVLWTIPVEVQFYAVFPLIWFLWRKSSAVAWASVVCAVCAIAWLGFPRTPALAQGFSFFAIGLCVSRLNVLIVADRSIFFELIFVFFLLLYVILLPQIKAGIGLPSVGILGLPLYMFSLGVLLFATIRSRIAKLVFGNIASRALGKISYSMYLVHSPVLVWILADQVIPKNIGALLIFFLISVVGLSTVTYWCIELPLRNWISGRATSPSPAPASV